MRYTMLQYELQEEEDTSMIIETSHARYFQLNMELLSVTNPVLTEIFKILEDNISTYGMIEQFEEEGDNNDYAFQFKQIYQDLEEVMINYCPVPLILLIFQREYSPEDAGVILEYVEQENLEELVYESKELFKNLTSLLKKSYDFKKTIKIKDVQHEEY